MQPVSRSRTMSLIVPTSLPSAERMREPMILLLWTKPCDCVCVVVVDWVCALAGAMARPARANAAPNMMDFFIGVKRLTECSFRLFRAATHLFVNRGQIARVGEATSARDANSRSLPNEGYVRSMWRNRTRGAVFGNQVDSATKLRV